MKLDKTKPESAGAAVHGAADALPGSHRILRFHRGEIALHWAIAAPFLICLLTAAALVLLYNPDPARPGRALVSWIHRISGVALIILPPLAVWWHRDQWRLHLYNLKQGWIWTADDLRWLVAMGKNTLLRKNLELPEQGKFNAAEKLNFMMVMTTVPIFAVTGVMIWSPEVAYYAWLVHFTLAVIEVPLVAGHIFMATVNPDTRVGLSGMFDGHVDRTWASHHYTKWYRELYGEPPHHDTSESDSLAESTAPAAPAAVGAAEIATPEIATPALSDLPQAETDAEAAPSQAAPPGADAAPAPTAAGAPSAGSAPPAPEEPADPQPVPTQVTMPRPGRTALEGAAEGGVDPAAPPPPAREEGGTETASPVDVVSPSAAQDPPQVTVQSSSVAFRKEAYSGSSTALPIGPRSTVVRRRRRVRKGDLHPKVLHSLCLTQLAAGHIDGAVESGREAIRACLRDGRSELVAELLRALWPHARRLRLDHEQLHQALEALVEHRDWTTASKACASLIKRDAKDAKAIHCLLSIAAQRRTEENGAAHSERIYEYLLKNADDSFRVEIAAAAAAGQNPEDERDREETLTS